MLELLVHVVQLRVLQLDAVLQDVHLPLQPELLPQQLLLLLVVPQLDLRHVLLVLPDQGRAVLAALVVVPGHPHVLGRQNADVAQGNGHPVPQRVQVGLELAHHLL